MVDSPNPNETAAYGDPGDETQRNFRYQHGYGAILLIAGASKTQPYEAIWCEHHEDLLAERTDGGFEAFQIKTRQPELGPWETKHEEVIGSIKRFVSLHQLFSSRIIRYCFVSNTNFFTCGWDVDKDRLKKSIVRLLEAVQIASSYNKIKDPFLDVFESLVSRCGCTPDTLFNVLKHTSLIKGPPRDNFDAEISFTHLAELDVCRAMPKATLNAVRDEIIQNVYKASSLHVDDPMVHLVNIDSKLSPTMKAKRVSVSVVSTSIEQSQTLVFRYQPVDITLALGKHISSTKVLEKKFIKGGLVDQISTMKRRTISTERHLFEKYTYGPTLEEGALAQLESIVQAECDEASLDAKVLANSSTNYGPTMLKNVYDRLKRISQTKIVLEEPYEVLVGFAGLLTENCSIWWSEKFDLNDSL